MNPTDKDNPEDPMPVPEIEDLPGPSITDWPYLPPVLDSAGCARLLGMRSDAEVKRLARERKLPSVKFGKRVLFLTDEVIACLRKLQKPVIDDADFHRRGRVDRVAEREE